MSFLMPTAVRPAVGFCGTYLAVGSSNGDKALSGITQVIELAEEFHKFKTDIFIFKCVQIYICFYCAGVFFPCTIKLNTSANVIHSTEFMNVYFSVFSVFYLLKVLINVLSLRKNMSDSLAYGRLHPQLQPNTLLVDGEFYRLTYLLCNLVQT